MRRGCCSTPAHVCTPCCLPPHNLSVEFSYRTGFFVPGQPSPIVFSLPLIYNGTPNLTYTATVPRENVTFEAYALGSVIPPGTYDTGGTPYPPSEFFYMSCFQDQILVGVVRTLGPFSQIGGGGYWAQIVSESLFSFTSTWCSAYVEEYSCDPIHIKFLTRTDFSTTEKCAWGGTPTFLGTILDFTITDPGGDAGCDTPPGATVYIPLSACSSSLEGVNATLSHDGDIVCSATSDSSGYFAFDVPWLVQDYDVSIDPDTLPFRNIENPNSHLSINPNISYPANQSISLILTGTPSDYCICMTNPTKIPVKNTLYLTDSVLGSTVLSQNGFGPTPFWRGFLSFTTPLYTRPDGITCPSVDMYVSYGLDGTTGLLSVSFWADWNYCPHAQIGENRIAEETIRFSVDLSMVSENIVMFNAVRDWSQAGSNQASVKNIHQYVYNFSKVTYLITE